MGERPVRSVVSVNVRFGVFDFRARWLVDIELVYREIYRYKLMYLPCSDGQDDCTTTCWLFSRFGPNTESLLMRE